MSEAATCNCNHYYYRKANTKAAYFILLAMYECDTIKCQECYSYFQPIRMNCKFTVFSVVLPITFHSSTYLLIYSFLSFSEFCVRNYMRKKLGNGA